MGTTAEWALLSTGPDAGYVFLPNTEYVGVFSITRSDFQSVDLFCSLHQGTNLLASYGDGDTGDIANNFGMLGFWHLSNTFGSTTAAGEFEDNGITFSNIKIETIRFVTQSPMLNIKQAGSEVVLSWPTEGSDGFQLESAPSLVSPVTWSSNGPPPVVVGDSYVVTNSAIDSEKYYRLTQ